MHNSEYYFIFFIIIIMFYHHRVLNKIEKQFFLEYFGYDNVKRPKSGNIMSSKNDLGMPSGHTETTTLLLVLLYFYKYIPLWICILVILLVASQRITSESHTIIQAMIGIIFGVIYAYIYKTYDLSLKSFGIVILFSLLLTALVYYKVLNKLN